VNRWAAPMIPTRGLREGLGRGKEAKQRCRIRSVDPSCGPLALRPRRAYGGEGVAPAAEANDRAYTGSGVACELYRCGPE
jgi:hypothetical protein